ncbi:MAG: hypothetical protein BZ138_07665 [Methanosphaera sp. rholeuAM270]|nr:MAG: hypothetical protein BZ138_07665 [Methanosphaera sp. rholeuAM270]
MLVLTDKDNLLQFIRIQQRDINNKISKKKFKKLHHRKKYYKIIERVNSFLEQEEYNKRFIAMPGLRGVGKSTIIYQIYDYLINNQNIDNNNILYLDVDELTSNYNTRIQDVFDIYIEYYQNTIPTALEEKIFLLIDETHYDKNWARFAKTLFDKTPNIFMIFTGSSALELESNTDAVRRMKIERIYPMNFREYLLLNYNIKIEKFDIEKLLFYCDDENLKNAIMIEKGFHNNLLKINNDPYLELKQYIKTHSFPFALNQDINDTYDDINEVIRRIIKEDLELFKKHANVSSQTISQIVTYLATKKSGKTKNSTIAQSTEISSNTVKDILQTLELTQLIFSLNAYGPGGKILKSSKEHFFITSNIKAAINYSVKRYDLENDKCYSLLVENMVTSNIYYLINKTSDSMGLFYDSEKKGVDLLIKYSNQVIPVEIGIGNKTKSQLTRALNKYNSPYGILVSNRTSNIKYKNNILYIPLLTFALLI